MVRNILAVWDRAQPSQYLDGASWYQRAHDQAKEIARTSEGRTTLEVATVISILSPSNKWTRNIDDARNLIRAHDQGGDIQDVRVATYGPNKVKAWSYLGGEIDGEPFSPRAQKTQAFALLISDPSLPHVVVDGHATNIACGDRGPITSAARLTPKRYLAVSDAYRHAAKAKSVSPHIMQATTWVVWRQPNPPRDCLPPF